MKTADTAQLYGAGHFEQADMPGAGGWRSPRGKARMAAASPRPRASPRLAGRGSPSPSIKKHRRQPLGPSLLSANSMTDVFKSVGEEVKSNNKTCLTMLTTWLEKTKLISAGQPLNCVSLRPRAPPAEVANTSSNKQPFLSPRKLAKKKEEEEAVRIISCIGVPPDPDEPAGLHVAR